MKTTCFSFWIIALCKYYKTAIEISKYVDDLSRFICHGDSTKIFVDVCAVDIFVQGRINHWANRANVRGLALEYQNTSLLVFHVFRLFTTRQNCRTFWLLCLAYRLRKLTALAIYRLWVT